MIYLAGPIDAPGAREGVKALRDEARAVLRQAGFAFFDPSTAYEGAVGSSPNAVHAINEAAIANADAVLALLPEGIPTIGTPMEIWSAAQHGVPVMVVGGGSSMQLKALAHRGVEIHSTVVGAVAGMRLRRLNSKLGDLAANLQPREIRWIGDPELEPQRHHEGDAGFDLVCSRDTRVMIGTFCDIPCEISMELPPGTWALITGRSSTLRKRGLLVHNSIIDNGYRGQMFAGAWNLGGEVAEVRRGERIAQLIPFKLEAPDIALRHVEALGESDRGVAGFGSTGI